MTDREGNYSIAGIVEGDYTLEVSKDTYLFNTGVPLQVTSGDVVVEEVSLIATHQVNGQIKDNNNVAMVDAVVTLKDMAGNVVATTTTDREGNYSFTGIVAADYSVEISKAGFRTQTSTLVISDGDATVEAIALARQIGRAHV